MAGWNTYEELECFLQRNRINTKNVRFRISNNRVYLQNDINIQIYPESFSDKKEYTLDEIKEIFTARDAV